MKAEPLQKSSFAACDIVLEHPTAIAKAQQAMPSSETLAKASAMLKAVADPTRLRILAALRPGPLCVCDIAAVLEMSLSAISHQLRLLREQKLLTGERNGKEIYYRLDDGHVVALIEGVLAHLEC
jgi:ArsR family transcriptional regulator, lead/cadmium/zinc/bismuth-responsive transcriptional repressor